MSVALPVAQISEQDLTGITEEQLQWVRPLLYVINTLTQNTNTAFNAGLTLQENFDVDLKRNITFTTPSTYTASNTFSTIKFQTTITSPSLILLGGIWLNSNPVSSFVGSVGITHWYNYGQEIRITYISGLADSTTYRLNLVII